MVNGVSINEGLYFLINKNSFVKEIEKPFIKNYNKPKRNIVEVSLYKGNFVDLNKSDNNLLLNKNFLNSQNYLSSGKRNFQLFYFSHEKRNMEFKEGKILIGKIKKDFLEKLNIKTLDFFEIDKRVTTYKVYVGTKFLYLKTKYVGKNI